MLRSVETTAVERCLSLPFRFVLEPRVQRRADRLSWTESQRYDYKIRSGERERREAECITSWLLNRNLRRVEWWLSFGTGTDWMKKGDKNPHQPCVITEIHPKFDSSSNHDRGGCRYGTSLPHFRRTCFLVSTNPVLFSVRYSRTYHVPSTSSIFPHGRVGFRACHKAP